jgi:plastocyanin
MAKALSLGALALLGILAAGCAGSHGDAKEVNTVRMTNRLRYEPEMITITVGQTVRWKNVSIMTHTVTDDPSLAKKPDSAVLPPGAEPFDSGHIVSGKEFSHTFTVPGTYRYFCIPHESSGMTGSVIVEAPK